MTILKDASLIRSLRRHLSHDSACLTLDTADIIQIVTLFERKIEKNGMYILALFVPAAAAAARKPTKHPLSSCVVGLLYYALFFAPLRSSSSSSSPVVRVQDISHLLRCTRRRRRRRRHGLSVVSQSRVIVHTQYGNDVSSWRCCQPAVNLSFESSTTKKC
ncbi:unnamed protein product [Trichogramma brassicae]|uniref:Uncharacterized protein n=1 Tax=Trichogramma brassicae TaxID=86971 RepID=A0A6H5IR63_9HYME|nr:unnamed protein product [Trichogramma brassicae]